MGKIDRQHKNITKAGERLDRGFAKSTRALEDKLKTMGIVIPRTVPASA